MTNGIIIGHWPKNLQHTQHYFIERHCFVDCRGILDIHPSVMFGYCVQLVSMAHDIGSGKATHTVVRRLKIDNDVWVASFSLLYACWIQQGSVVSTGSVVSGVVVPPYSMVQGNPAKIVATYNNENKAWTRLANSVSCEPWPGRRA